MSSQFGPIKNKMMPLISPMNLSQDMDALADSELQEKASTQSSLELLKALELSQVT